MDLRHIIILCVQLSIPVTVFSFGLRATRDDVLYLVHRPSLFVRSLVAMFVIMPIVAVVMARMFAFRPEVEVALLALSISPVPPLLPRKEGKAGGRTDYGLGLMATMSLLAIVVVPFALWVVGRYFERSISIAPMKVATIALKATLIPLVAGMALRAIAPAIAHWLGKPVVLVAKVLLVIGLLGILGTMLPKAWALVGDGTVAAMTVFILIGLAVGHLLGGPELEERIVLALSTACRHPGIAIAVVAVMLPEEESAPTILLYVIVGAIVCIPYTMWQRKHLSTPAVLGAGSRA